MPDPPLALAIGAGLLLAGPARADSGGKILFKFGSWVATGVKADKNSCGPERTEDRRSGHCCR